MASIKSYTLKDGTVKWEYFISNGKNKGTGFPNKIHKKGFPNETAAKNAAKIIEGEIASNTYIRKNPKKMTITSYLDEWINNYKQSVKEGTRIVYRDTIRMYIDPYIGKYQLNDYDREAHQKFINMVFNLPGKGKSGCGLSWSTVNVINGCLSNAFNKAVQLGYIASNPTDHIEFPRDKRPKKNEVPKHYTPKEAEKFLAYAKDEREPFWYIFFLCVFDLGLRKGEVMALRWSDFNLKDNSVAITQERLYRKEQPGQIYLDETKTPAGERELIITGRLKNALVQFYNQSYETSNVLPLTSNNTDFLFIYSSGKNKGYPVRARSTNTAWDRIIRKAGLPNIRLHDGRHTHAIRLRQAGVSLEDIKDLLGHKEVKTTQVYAQVTPEVKEKAINKLELYYSENN